MCMLCLGAEGRQGAPSVFSDGVASVTHVELNNSVITEVARANSSVGMVPKEEDEDQSGSEDGGDAADGGGKKKGGKKSAKGKKDKKGKKGDKKDKKKKDKKDKKEKKDKKGKKKGGKKNKNNNNRNCDGNESMLDTTLEDDDHQLGSIPEEDLVTSARFNTPRDSARTCDGDAILWLGDDMHDVDPMQFSRAHERSVTSSNARRPESRCSMRSPVDSILLPVPGFVRHHDDVDAEDDFVEDDCILNDVISSRSDDRY